MKIRRALAILALAAAAGGACGAGAQMMGGGGMGFSNGISRGVGRFGSPWDMQVVANGWLATLQAQLHIDRSQEPAWQAFANAVAAQGASMQSMRTLMMQSTSLGAPQRALLAEDLLDRRLDAMTAVTDTLTALYSQLSAAQRAVLDEAFTAQCGPYGLFGN
jgi:LTXXQ motif family protein